MGQYSVVTRKVVLDAAGGAAATLRVYDKPASMPISNLSIVLSTAGQVTAVGNLTWTVYYGGTWAGTPFDSDHTGGSAQGTAAIVGGTEIADVVYTDVNLLPPNNVAGPNSMREYGLPIVIELVNAKAAEVTVFVTFVREHALTNVG